MTFCVSCGTALPSTPPARCVGCGRTSYLNPPCCAGALVVDDGRLLLARRAIEPWEGHWDIPGGYCEPGEHPRECAVRETYEETGLRIVTGGLHGIWVDPPGSTSSETGTICIYYHAILAQVPTPDPAPPVGTSVVPGSVVPGNGDQAGRAETSEIAWFEPSSTPSSLAFPGSIPAVIRAWRTAMSRDRTPQPSPDVAEPDAVGAAAVGSARGGYSRSFE